MYIHLNQISLLGGLDASDSTIFRIPVEVIFHDFFNSVQVVRIVDQKMEVSYFGEHAGFFFCVVHKRTNEPPAILLLSGSIHNRNGR
jgi:hypothetical protein